jgi:sigma-B regulation protein RsbU (phosphoserine phosphatase)
MFPELSAVDMFITAQLAIVDVRRETLIVASAGHCPLLVAVPDGWVDAIAPDGVPIGILPNAVFPERIVPLHQCCCALFYTDGLTEARNRQGGFFGQERLMSWLYQALEQGQTAAQLTESFKAELRLFQGDSSLSDDQTFLLLCQEKIRAAISREKLLEALPVLAPLSNRNSS